MVLDVRPVGSLCLFLHIQHARQRRFIVGHRVIRLIIEISRGINGLLDAFFGIDVAKLARPAYRSFRQEQVCFGRTHYGELHVKVEVSTTVVHGWDTFRIPWICNHIVRQIHIVYLLFCIILGEFRIGLFKRQWQSDVTVVDIRLEDGKQARVEIMAGDAIFVARLVFIFHDIMDNRCRSTAFISTFIDTTEECHFKSVRLVFFLKT